MPHCSIIIPHFNQIEHLKKCLDALEGQKVETFTYEVIVVDNGSEVDITPICKHYSTELFIVSDIQNPYICRNKGIKNAKGDVIAFLDAKCIPNKNWLQNGLSLMDSYDLLSGRYEVGYGTSVSSKVFPLMYLNSEKNIKNGYGISAGNLFVRKSVFNHIGLFQTGSASGNDILLSKKAESTGFRMGVASTCMVTYPQKTFDDLIRDVRKYGKGAVLTGQKSFVSILIYLMPMRLQTLKEAIKYRKYNFTFRQKVIIWVLIWKAKTQFALGIWDGVLEKIKNKAK
ncbi:MAG: glycosyltransferase [Saprospiraceae bacterium]